MQSVLKVSGKSWAGSAAIWGAFAILISGLADDRAEPSSSRLAWQAAAAAMVPLDRMASGNLGAAQVAKVDIAPLDLTAIAASEFGDSEELQ